MEPLDNKGMEKMFKLQLAVIERLKPIQKLPDYPLDLNKRESQEFLKKMSYCVLEELAEAAEESEKIFEAVSTNNLELAKVHCRDFNIEISDTLHFILEVLIYSGCDEYMLFTVIESLLMDRNMESLMIRDDLLGTLFNIGAFLNRDLNPPKQSKFMVFKTQETIDQVNSAGLSRISKEVLGEQSKFLWEITKKLLLSMNQLKNKEWNQSERMVNVVKYFEHLVDTVIVINQYFSFVGLTPISLFNNFLHKDRIIHERINEKY